MTGPKVTALDAAVYVVPTDAPEADGTLTWDKTTMVVVTARAGGERGIGWSYTSAAAAAVAAELLAGTVIGRDAFDVAGAAEAMARQVRNVGRPGIAAMAISAADIALWDLKARLLGVALSGLLGQARDDVPVYGSGGFTSYPDGRTAEQLGGWVEEQRIPRVKIKIGESWGGAERRDLARVRLAREVIGPDAELYVDANGGYSTGQAVRVAAELDACGVTWFEEPVSAQDLAGLAAIRRQVRPDVAAGEYSWSLADSAALIADDAVLTCDSGTIATWAARHWTIRGGRQFYLSGNLATMAPGLPYAVGIQHAFPGRQVIAYVGDGGFAMLMAEFLTAARAGLPVKVVVNNNNSLGQILWEQMVLGYPEHGVRFPQPASDFAAWARACGGYGAKVSDPKKVRPAIHEALAFDGPALVDIDVDPNEPPLPGKVAYDQAKKFAQAFLKGQPHKAVIATTLFKDKIEQLRR